MNGTIHCPSMLELSYGQLRMWLIHELEASSSAYNLGWTVRLLGKFDFDIFQTAIHALVRRHDVLRTAILNEKGQPVARLLPPDYCVARLPLGQAPVSEQQAIEAAKQFVRKPFELRAGPLRVALFVLTEGHYILSVAVHHIACDGYSLQVMRRELLQGYALARSGQPGLQARRPAQYVDFARWQRQVVESGKLQHQLAFWTARLSPLPPQVRPCADWDSSSSQSSVAVTTLPMTTTRQMRRLCAGHRVTPLMILMAAYLALVHRLTGEEDLTIGTPVSNRAGRDFRDAVGFMSNTVVVRVSAAGNPCFEEFLGRVREASLDAFEHSDLPFEQVVAAVGATGQPLPVAMMTWTDIPSEPSGLDGLQIEPIRIEPAEVKLDVSIDAWRQQDTVGVSLQLRHQPGKENLSRHLCDRFMTHLDDVVERPSARLSQFQVLGTRERAMVVEQYNRTTRHDSAEPIPSRIARQAALTPHSPAVISPSLTVDYATLLAWSSALQCELTRAHVRPGDIIPLVAEAGAAAVAGMLAVLATGAVLAPLDPAWPRLRLERLLQRFASKTLLADSAVAQRLGWLSGIVMSGPCGGNDLEVKDQAGDDNPAYLMLTSGSTGEPKGVVCLHRGLINRFNWMDREIGPVAGARILQTTRPQFDSSLWQCLWPLTRGGAVVIPSPHDLADGGRLAHTIHSQKITLIDFVPSILRHHLPELERDAAALSSLHTVIFGGERLESPTAAAARALLPRARLLNLYGPTEATIGCIWHEIGTTIAPGETIPIGLPIDNVEALILDATSQPCALWQPGELCLGGACLAQGYFGDPTATAARFIDNPFPELQSARLYRTGDRACRRSDGRILFLGRLDEEIKIRGLRIDPTEIEHALSGLEGIKAAAVVADAARVSLIAYVVLDARQTNTAKVGRALRERLPTQMLPAHIIALDHLPTTPAGKVDRKALATRELPSEPAHLARATGAADIIAGLMASLLQVTDVGPHSSFFVLGGHSLLALKLIARIDEVFGVALPLADLFEDPSPAGIACALERGTEPAAATPDPIDVDEAANHWPLSHAQRHMWMVDQMMPANTFYLHGRSWRIKGRIDIPGLRAALRQLMTRHPLLRARLTVVAGTPRLRIETIPEPPLRVIDTQRTPDGVIAEELRGPFDLGTAPLFRVLLVRGASDEDCLGICVHHMIADAWSIDVFARDLARAYRTAEQDAVPESVTVDPAALLYAKAQETWLASASATRELTYWRERFRTPTAQLPRDTGGVSGMRFSVGRVRQEVSPEQANRLRAAAARQGCTLHTAVLAGVCMLLRELTNHPSIRLGTVVSQRGRAELDAAFGLFINTVAVEVTLPESHAAADTLHACRRAMLCAYQHAAAPFEWLMEQLLAEPEPVQFPFRTLLLLQQPLAAHEQFRTLEVAPADEGRFEEFAISGSDLELIVTVLQQGDRLTVLLEYKTQYFSRSSALRWLARLIEHFAAMAHSLPDSWPS